MLFCRFLSLRFVGRKGGRELAASERAAVRGGGAASGAAEPRGRRVGRGEAPAAVLQGERRAEVQCEHIVDVAQRVYF